MERLTFRDGNGEAWYSDKGTEADRLHFIADIEDILGDTCDLDRMRELVQADQEGRCVVLSTPMRPMICKPNDTDVYCPRCGETLSGGWPESDYDDYRKMVQCPNCGESIDDNKCEPAEKER